MTQKTEKWETEPFFEAFQKCCVQGGADKRALPHFIKSLLSSQQKRNMKKIVIKIKSSPEPVVNSLVGPGKSLITGFRLAKQDILDQLEKI